MSRRRGKYGAIRTTVHGWTFDSKREAARYQDLLLLGEAGEIRNLELQPSYPISIFGHPICVYRADFAYDDASGHVVEDVKGYRTAAYRLKKKLVEAQYGIPVRET